MQTECSRSVSSQKRSFSNLAEMFLAQTDVLAEHTALKYKQKPTAYQEMSWRDFGVLVEELAFGLAALGLTPGESVGILCPTSHLWVAADLATICNGAISVPLYPNCSLSDIEHILSNSEATVVFVSGDPLLRRLLQAKAQLPKLKTIVFIPPLSEGLTPETLPGNNDFPTVKMIGLSELRAAGKPLSQQAPNLLRNRIKAIKRNDFATIIYTSGTTGIPKGVALTHGNILSVAEDLPAVIPLQREDIYLSYLPLSHVFERVCGEFYWIYSGCISAYAESIELLGKNMSEVDPSIMLVVPRVLDRIYNKVKGGIEGANPRARALIEWAISVGREVFTLQADNKPIRPLLKLKHILAEKLVFKKLRQRIGANLRCIISGGAPATAPVIEFFNSIGIPVLEGYGLTETSAPTHVNHFDKIKAGTVGPSLSSVQVKIDEEGEILLKGPTIFTGYFKDAESTAVAFINDWFRTGDIGSIDSDGYLKITDRKKDLLINSAGKNIAPQRIENVLKTIPHVSQVIVFGDKRKHLIALFTLDQQAVLEFAQEKGWYFASYEELRYSKQLTQHLKQEIASKSKDLADYELVRNFAVLPADFAVENGELTATLKVKRNVIAQRFADVINTLYRDEVAASK